MKDKTLDLNCVHEWNTYMKGFPEEYILCDKCGIYKNIKDALTFLDELSAFAEIDQQWATAKRIIGVKHTLQNYIFKHSNIKKGYLGYYIKKDNYTIGPFRTKEKILDYYLQEYTN